MTSSPRRCARRCARCTSKALASGSPQSSAGSSAKCPPPDVLGAIASKPGQERHPGGWLLLCWLLAQWPEAGANLFREELRLFPGREVAASVELVVMDEVVGIRALCPAPRRLIEL